MNVTSALPTTLRSGFFNPDRLGVAASILCAIHCAATPFLLFFAPAFGRTWAHPASHWLIALFVVPLAWVMVARGFRKHGKRWVVAAGAAGIALVVVGAAVPYLKAEVGSMPSGASGEAALTSTPGVSADASESGGCADDSCCPSVTVDEAGKAKLGIPLASVITTLGGIFLILTHIGNLCSCSACPASKCKVA